MIQASNELKQVAGSVTKRKEICSNALNLVFKERQALKNGQRPRLTGHTHNLALEKYEMYRMIILVLHVTEWEEFGFAGKPAGNVS